MWRLWSRKLSAVVREGGREVDRLVDGDIGSAGVRKLNRVEVSASEVMLGASVSVYRLEVKASLSQKFTVGSCTVDNKPMVHLKEHPKLV